MIARWLLAICVLPGTVLIIVPMAILLVSARLGVALAPAGVTSLRFWVAVVFLSVGASLGLWTMSLFFRFGEGTPAPWDPPTRFVVRGPYRHVRNPMIAAVILMLVGESLLTGSWIIGAWTGLFFLGNAIYIPLVEEPALAKRFENYADYCRNVRRWFPRWTRWKL